MKNYKAFHTKVSLFLNSKTGLWLSVVNSTLGILLFSYGIYRGSQRHVEHWVTVVTIGFLCLFTFNLLRDARRLRIIDSAISSRQSGIGS